MTPRPILDLVAASRLFDLRRAIVATLSWLFPDVQVVAHPGKIDMSDVIAGGVFAGVSMHVAATRLPADAGTSAGQMASAVDLAVYVVAEDRSYGEPKRLVTRDEIALALCDALKELLEQPSGSASRWGLSDVGYPVAVEAKPLFTAKSYAKGLVFWAVTWRQDVYRDAPLWDMDSPVPGPPPPIPPPVILPGDPVPGASAPEAGA